MYTFTNLLSAKDGYEKYLRMGNEIVDRTVLFLRNSRKNLQHSILHQVSQETPISIMVAWSRLKPVVTIWTKLLIMLSIPTVRISSILLSQSTFHKSIPYHIPQFIAGKICPVYTFLPSSMIENRVSGALTLQLLV